MSGQSSILRVCKHYDNFFNLEHLTGDIIIICPSPVIADSVSERLGDRSVATVTISHFSREILKNILADDFGDLFKRKSELNLLLATAWKKQFGQEKTFSLYKQAFNLYTELRSYTLDREVISDILELYPEDIRVAILWFDQLISILEIHDEHSGYVLIKESARMSEEECLTPKGKNIIFWGFPYFSGVQVDMIKSLAIRNHVEIPITEYVYGCSIKTDWVQWFDTEKTIKPVSLEPVECRVVEIGKNKLSSSIERLWDKKETDILLVEKQVSMVQALEISIPKLAFKIPIDFLSHEVEKLFTELASLQAVDDNLLTDTALIYLKEELQGELQQIEGNWKRVKALTLVHSIILTWSELASINDNISLFDLEVLQESSLLDATRNFQYNMVRKPNGKLVGLEGLDALDLERSLYICATSKYNRLNTTGTPFVRGVNEILKDIAPLRRYRFEFEVFKEKITRILRSQNVVLFLEKELEKIDRGWAEIMALHTGSREKISHNSKSTQVKPEYLFLDKKITKKLDTISASRLQHFIDCPAKYYYIKNEPLETRFTDKLSLGPAELGQIEHDVIEKFFTQRGAKNIAEVALEQCTLFLKKENKIISNILRQSYLQEIEMYAQNGVNCLNHFIEADPNVKFIFEKSQVINHHGIQIYTRPDCLIQGDVFRGVLDFKRSASSVASAQEVLAYSKIQLPFYVKYALEKISEQNIMGYISLASPTDSKFWSSEKELLTIAYGCCDKKLSRPKLYLINEWEEYFEEFDSYIGEQIQALQQERDFFVNNKNTKVCNYCPVTYLCSHKINEVSHE